MKHKIYECDICHRQQDYPEDGTLILKTRKHWSCWDESGWATKKIYVCPECIKDFSYIMSKIRESRLKKRDVS